ncbi:hypothetical protein [Nocardia salmonicida]|uniref:hypothetical protein n=1 Tax=Nocardia salmonicida TaxID=53431 RepID=UPI002E2BF4FD|nr:hypothetical protein [Nocardia salmonicida]
MVTATISLVAVPAARVLIPVIALITTTVTLIAVPAARVLIPVIALITTTVTLIAVPAARVLIPVIALITTTVTLIAVPAARVRVAVVPAMTVVSRTRDEPDGVAGAESTTTRNLGGAESCDDSDLFAGADSRLSSRKPAISEDPENARGPGHHGCSSHPTGRHAPPVPSSITQLTPLRSDPDPRALRTAAPENRPRRPLNSSWRTNQEGQGWSAAVGYHLGWPPEVSRGR